MTLPPREWCVFLIVAREDPRDLINAVFPNLDAFGPNGDHEVRLAFPRQFVLVPRMTISEVSPKKPCSVFRPRTSSP